MMRAAMLGLMLGGCLSEPNPADYDAVCEIADDCGVAFNQGYCGACGGWTALSVEGASDFEEDQDRYTKQKTCREYILPECIYGDEPAADCDEGRCVIAE